MEEKTTKSFRVSKTEKALTEGRVALISILIAVPAAFLIAMLIHYFVEIPEQNPFFSETVVVTPQKYMPEKAKRPSRIRKSKSAEKQDLAELYDKKIKLCTANLKELELAYKSGSALMTAVVEARSALLLAEGELFRYENKIRRWGNSISDLAVRAETAKKAAEAKQREFKSGAVTMIDVNKVKAAALDLEIQLKSHRTFSDEDWQKAYAAYQKDPGVKTYRAMLEAEQAARPPRRF